MKKYVGSSPRAWGTLTEIARLSDLVRFIPACVGNPRSRGGRPTEPRVHPACVGNAFKINREIFPKGRFIPACVGNALRATDCFNSDLTMSNSVPLSHTSFSLTKACGRNVPQADMLGG
jgi:hypothetical protein